MELLASSSARSPRAANAPARLGFRGFRDAAGFATVGHAGDGCRNRRRLDPVAFETSWRHSPSKSIVVVRIDRPRFPRVASTVGRARVREERFGQRYGFRCRHVAATLQPSTEPRGTQWNATGSTSPTMSRRLGPSPRPAWGFWTAAKTIRFPAPPQKSLAITSSYEEIPGASKMPPRARR